MSNLSDLLPAGASAKQITATDSGSGIASKAPVILNSDGTVSPIAIGADSAGTPTYFSGSSQAKTQGGMASNGSGEILYAYRANNGYGTVQVVSYATPGGSITYGTPVTFLSSSTGGVSCAYDAQSGYYVVAYTNSGSNFVGEVRCVSVSGTTPTAYTASSLSSYPYQVSNTDCEYDPTQQMTFVAYDYNYDDGGSFFYGGGQVRLCQPSSAYNPPTLHGNVDAVGGSYSFLGRASMVYDPSVSKTVIHFCNTLGNASSKIISVSGTSLSFSSSTAFNSGYTTNPFATYDSNQNAQVVAYRDSSNKGYVIAGTTGASSLTYGTEVEFSDGNQVNSDSNALGVDYDATAQKVVIVYADDGDSDNGKVVFASVSGTAVTVTTPIYLDGSTGTPVDAFASAYDATGKRVIVTYRIASNDQTKLNAVAPGLTNLTAQAFVGVADSAISASAAGSIIVQGGTVSGVSLPEALTFGPSSVFESANAIDICAAFDSSNNRVVFAYKDSGNSPGQGTAVVATLGGTSLTYGTPVVFEADETREPSIAFDSNENKIVIAYREDNAPSYLGKSVVGTVDPSDNSITFGTAVQFSAANAYNTTTVFDSNSNRIVIGYRDTSNSNKGTAVVGTVSGTSITYGTPVVYDSGAVQNYGGGGFDSTSNQAVFCYVVGADEKCILGAVDPSDNSITYGAAATIASNGTGFRSVSFDSTNNRVVETFSDGSTGKTMCAVGTVSGTSISFGTPVVAESSVYAGYVGSAFDVSSGRMVIVVNTASSGYGFTGAVSGTTITVDSSTVTFLSGDPNYVNAVYESNANKVVVSYGDATNSNYGTGVVATYGAVPLTTGTKYFVAPTGGFSSTAGSPSVNAGLAISTTSLLLNGDS